MKFFADTADLAALRELSDRGLLDGVTTNPTLVVKSGRDLHETIAAICELTDGPVSAEVVGRTADEMIAEGLDLSKIASNVVVKVPLTDDGLMACRALVAQRIAVNVTLCFSLVQAILAAKAGASFISPFVGRLDDINTDGMELVRDIRHVYDTYDFETKVLAASIRTANHVGLAALAGADAVTMPPSVLRTLVHHPLTDIGLEKFLADWSSARRKQAS